jgi:hypothetical protein
MPANGARAVCTTLYTAPLRTFALVENVNGSVFLFSRFGATMVVQKCRERSMSDLTDCRGMEQLYRERAKSDPKNSTKWLGQAERWADLAGHERAWRFQRRGSQQMHAGPMATQPTRTVGSGRQMG